VTGDKLRMDDDSLDGVTLDRCNSCLSDCCLYRSETAKRSTR